MGEKNNRGKEPLRDSGLSGGSLPAVYGRMQHDITRVLVMFHPEVPAGSPLTAGDKAPVLRGGDTCQLSRCRYAFLRHVFTEQKQSAAGHTANTDYMHRIACSGGLHVPAGRPVSCLNSV